MPVDPTEVDEASTIRSSSRGYPIAAIITAGYLIGSSIVFNGAIIGANLGRLYRTTASIARSCTLQRERGAGGRIRRLASRCVLMPRPRMARPASWRTYSRGRLYSSFTGTV